jgi:hypothetical protein
VAAARLAVNPVPAVNYFQSQSDTLYELLPHLIGGGCIVQLMCNQSFPSTLDLVNRLRQPIAVHDVLNHNLQ